MEKGLLLRLVGVMNHILINFMLSICYSRKTTLLVQVRKRTKPFNIGLYSDIYRLISYSLGKMIEVTKLYILILFRITLTIIKIKNFGVHFFFKFMYRFGLNSVCCHNMLVC